MRRSTFILTDVKHDGVASSVGGFSACLGKGTVDVLRRGWQVLGLDG